VKTVFSTQEVHPRERFDCWHSVACKEITNHTSQPDMRPNFEAEIEVGGLGNLELILFRNSPMQVWHTAAHASCAKSDHLFVCHQLSGGVTLEQDTREITLDAGCLTLLDPLLPYKGRFLRDSKMLVVKAPRRELEARLGKTRDMVVRPIKPNTAQDRLTSSVIALLPSLARETSSISDSIIGSDVLDLIAVSLAKAVEGARPRLSSVKALVLLNIRAAIEARLTDPKLDPQAIADAVGVSVRYANQVLAEQGTSLTRLVLARRLARCRSALEDPTQAHRMLSEIAYGWGFRDLTHFGRRFKQAYGILPSEARAGLKGERSFREQPKD
jgi:AraC family transcriptional regulator, positive regulator of tynA and feaB